jgi:sugar/nucleoside kinase (ribokinase family)
MCTRDEFLEILSLTRSLDCKTVPGGAAANTAHGVSKMGGRAYFCGGIGDDEFGRVIAASFQKAGVDSTLCRYGDPTGCVAALVTPDAERTFAVYLGSSLLLTPDAVDPVTLKQSTFLYTTGYQFEPELLRSVIISAASQCRTMITRIAFDLADPGIVHRHLSDIRAFVREYVDILFCNEETAHSYTGLEDEAGCLDRLSEDASTVFLTRGPEGSLVAGGSSVDAVPAFPADPVDTTGAGDAYSAAALVGLDHGFSPAYCGKMGSYAGRLVIEQKGARLERNIARELQNL